MSNGSGLFGNQGPALPHLVKPGGGLSGEIADLRGDIVRVMGPLAAMTVDEFIDPALADVDGLELATASQVALRTVTAFVAGGVAALAAYARNVTITTAGSTPADAPATALVTGTYNGAVQTETINVPQTVTTAVGLKPFDTVTSVAYSAGDGTDCTQSIGFGAGLGVSKVPLARGGGVNLIREVEAGALVVTGALTAAGLYTPATPPDAANDYAIYYEYDVTA